MPGTLDLKNAKTGMGLYQLSPVTLTDGDYIPPLVDATGALQNSGILQAATVFASQTLSANGATNSADQTNLWGRAAFFTLNVSAITGTTVTLDIKLQSKDPISGNYVDIPLYVITQCTVAQGVQTRLMVVTGVGAAAAGALVLGCMPLTWRAVATVASGANPSVTFSLGVQYAR